MRPLLLLFPWVLPSRASGRPSFLRSHGHPARRADRRHVIAISQTGRWRLWGEKVMGMALWQARHTAQPEPSSLALTHPTPGTSPAPRFPLLRDCGLMASGHAGLRAAMLICPSHTWGVPAEASRAFCIFASWKLRCPRCPQKEGFLRRQEECTIWPSRGKQIFQYPKENQEGRSPGEAAAHGHVPRVFLLTLLYPHPLPLQPSPRPDTLPADWWPSPATSVLRCWSPWWSGRWWGTLIPAQCLRSLKAPPPCLPGSLRPTLP